ncbi:hypothetical protein BJF83_17315 [Nocardiopsis sp. CNR-923]|uniref:DUF5403 family protein n=1 Tax=Nocardiopsis sp. CNR-923 TaxID=1904965 RepID=UPI0009625CBD|nr:DUF5403 family protein [Nocardiopsis sp. CNR-923]OLT27746.1 hypothetical protein BJF83_17315 [Nocardiopsis sp. CNR-923]
MATLYRSLERTVARLPGMGDAVHEHAEQIGDTARGLLAAHRSTGTARVTVTRGRVDSFVNLEDPNALSLEFGRAAGVSDSGRAYGAMEGLYILHRAAGWR